MLFSLRFIKVTACIFMVQFGVVSTVVAIPVEWTFSNVIFDDGGALTGRWTFDLDSNSVMSFDITTTGGSVLSGHRYTDMDPTMNAVHQWTGGYDMLIVGEWSTSPSPSWSGWIVTVSFDPQMTNDGGVIAIVPSPPFCCSRELPFSVGYPHPFVRWIESGEMIGTRLAPIPEPPPSPIPEPSTYAMMLVGLGMLGWVGRGKKLTERAAA